MKVRGTLGGLLGGVTQQAPELARRGQVQEMFNMIPDPQTGLRRRQGGNIMSKRSGVSNLPPPVDLVNAFGTHEFKINGSDSTLIYPKKLGTGGNGERMLVWKHQRNENDHTIPVFAEWQTGGVGSTYAADFKLAAQAGRVTLLVPQVEPLPHGQDLGPVMQRDFVFNLLSVPVDASWKFVINVTVPGGFSGTFTVQDQWKTEVYPTAFNAGAVSYSPPDDYNQRLAAAQYSYDVARMAWEAARRIENDPASIIQRIATAINVAVGAPIMLSNNGLLYSRYGYINSVTLTTAAAKTSFQFAYQSVQNVTDLPAQAPNGMILAVRGDAGSKAMYFKATVAAGNSGHATWTETSGSTRTLEPGLVYGVPAKYLGQDCMVFGTRQWVNTWLLANDLTTAQIPPWTSAQCGDSGTDPLPSFVQNGRIDFIGMVQDRLCIGSGGDLRFSQPGDYFNLWRNSMATLTGLDGFELPLGDDTIRHVRYFDKDAVLIGDRLQYSIPGGTAWTATNNTPTVLASFSACSQYAPCQVGTLLYMIQSGSTSKLRQLVPNTSGGISPEGYDASSTLSDYLGTAIEISSSNSGHMLFLRDATRPHYLNVLNVLDIPGEGRKQEAWHRWHFFDEGLATGARIELVAVFRDWRGIGVCFVDTQGDIGTPWISLAAGYIRLAPPAVLSEDIINDFALIRPTPMATPLGLDTSPTQRPPTARIQLLEPVTHTMEHKAEPLAIRTLNKFVVNYRDSKATQVYTVDWNQSPLPDTYSWITVPRNGATGAEAVVGQWAEHIPLGRPPGLAVGCTLSSYGAGAMNITSVDYEAQAFNNTRTTP